MSQPISVDLLSDDDDGDSQNGCNLPATVTKEPVYIDLSTPVPSNSKKKPRLLDSNNSHPSNAAVLIVDNDPTPQRHSFGSTSTVSLVQESPPFSSPYSKFGDALINDCSKRSSALSSTPSIVEETPISKLAKAEVQIRKCSILCTSQSQLFSDSEPKSSEDRLIQLESDTETENLTQSRIWEHDASTDTIVDEERIYLTRDTSKRDLSKCSSRHQKSLVIETSQVCGLVDEDSDRLHHTGKVADCNNKSKRKANQKARIVDAKAKGRISKEERLRLNEEKKQEREQEKLQKAAQKAEAAEMKKLQKEKQKWEKGKFALKSIVAEIDHKVVEIGSIGGHLLTRFAEKGLSFRIRSNPVESSIVWKMTVPEELSQISPEGAEVQYLLLVYEAEDFCNLITSATIMDQVSRVRQLYPNYTVCFTTNRLMAYLNKREQSQYKDPTRCASWKRPPIEEILVKLTTNFTRVHSRLCVDEAELAEHVTGLTSSLAACQFRKKLTWLSVNANGSLVPKDCADKNLIKKNTWLKALIAIPKVQPRYAIAIWKKYPTMKSLLSVYMDPSKSVHEKEFLLKDLTTEGLLGDDRRLGEICSKRVYRVLMAQSGSIKTEDVENGADFFHR